MRSLPFDGERVEGEIEAEFQQSRSNHPVPTKNTAHDTNGHCCSHQEIEVPSKLCPWRTAWPDEAVPRSDQAAVVVVVVLLLVIAFGNCFWFCGFDRSLFCNNNYYHI